MDQPTADPDIVIEEQRAGFWRYRNIVTGRRWEIEGVCDHRGDCLVGAMVDGVMIRDREHLAEVAQGERLLSLLDVPVLPDFSDCCPLTGRWLEEA